MPDPETEHTPVLCPREGCTRPRLDADAPFCADDTRKIRANLWELPDRYRMLRAALVPSSGAGGGPKVSGSREAPLPLVTSAAEIADDIAFALFDWEDSLRRLEGFVPAGRARRWVVRDDAGRVFYQGPDRAVVDQVLQHNAALPYPTKLTVLATPAPRAEEPLRRDAVHHPDEARQVQAAADFLRTAADRLLAAPAGIDTGIEILELHRRATARLGLGGDKRPFPAPCPNPDCGRMTLTRFEGRDEIVCDRHIGGCGEVTTNVRQLARVLAVDLSEWLMTITNAAFLLNITPATARSWVNRGRLHPAGEDKRGRPLYRVGEVLILAQERKDQTA